jgi:hypothetical protein
MRSGDWREQIRAAIKTGDHLMVVTRGALTSEPCGWEWIIVWREGTEISPVLADPTLDSADLPKLMRASHLNRLDLNAPDLTQIDVWQRLFASLRDPPRGRRMPDVKREPVDQFVRRPTEMDARPGGLRLC